MNTSGQWTMKKLLMVGGLGIVALVGVFLFLNMHLTHKQDRLNELQIMISQSSIQMLMIRRHEKDYINRLDPKHRTKLDNEAESLKQKLLAIGSVKDDLSIYSDYNSLTSINAVNNYVDNFNLIADTLLKIWGHAKQDGLVNDLQRESIRFQRQILRESSPVLNQQMLVVQERMFDLFNDLSSEHKDKVDVALEQLLTIIVARPNSLALEQEYQQFYQVFSSLHDAVKSFGYDHSSGQIGQLRSTIHDVENELNTLYTVLPKAIVSQLEKLRIYEYCIAAILCLSIIIVISLVIRTIDALESGLVNSKQKEIKANKAKSSFLANMSHEIRTPLNGIIGMTEILNESRLSAVQKDYLTTLNSSSQTLLMLINDILDLSKIESGNLEVCPHTCAIKEVIFDTAALIAPKAQQKNVKIKIEMDKHVPVYVRADEQKLKQVMMNLASNAIKFTEAGAVTFNVAVVQQSENKITLRLAVKDTGIGIDESKHEQVFEEFQQESNQTSNEFGGTGLGLAISSKMISMMDSKIELISAKGLGCEFHFCLDLDVERNDNKVLNCHLPQVIYCTETPAHLLTQELKHYQYPLEVVNTTEEILSYLSDQAIIILDNNKEKISHCIQRYPNHLLVVARNNNEEKVDFGESVAGYLTLPLLGHRLDHLLKTLQHPVDLPESVETIQRKAEGMILVVEDNKVNQQVVGINLKKLGIKHKFANNGAEAVSLFKQHHEDISLILMDCMMPVMDGFEATSTIRRYEEMESIEETYIIALTASILDDDIQHCFDSGMNDYLPKPFKRAVLVEKLEKNIVFSLPANANTTSNDDAHSTVTNIRG